MYLSKEKILNKLTDETLYYYYCNIDVSKKIKKNPIRNEKDCSFRVKKIGNRIKWSDFGSANINKDIIDLIQIVKGWTFYETLIYINRDFKLGFLYSDKYNVDIEVETPTDIPVIKYNDIEEEPVINIVLTKYKGKVIYTKDDLKYWSLGNIDKNDLKHDKVYSVNTVLYNGNPIWLYHKRNPIYCYLYKKEVKTEFKLYRPLETDKQKKWLSNLSNAKETVDGILDIDLSVDYIIITKSKKDKMVLRKLGYNAISVQSESTGMTTGISQHLHQYYKRIYNLYDNDDTGIKFGNEFALEHNTIPIFIPTNTLCKDSWDLKSKYNDDKVKEILNNILI